MVAMGEVNYRGEITLTLSLRDHDGDFHDFPVLLDTGFTGYLTLPTVIADALALTPADAQFVTLGDGSEKWLPRYLVTVQWLGQELTAYALTSDGLPLIGLRLIQGCFITHHAVDGGAVMIYKP